MDYFEYRAGRLFVENTAVSDIARQTSTPAYIYSARTLREHYDKIVHAFAPLEPLVCYSVKSCSNIAILKLLAECGAGFDVVSGGELFRVLKSGSKAARCFYAGVGKTNEEIRYALNESIFMFNVESEAEFENLDRLARELGKRPRCALRINPDIDPKTHRYTSTGKRESKFGVDLQRAEEFFQKYTKNSVAQLTGVHLHLGSPIYTPEPYVEAIGKTLELISRLQAAGLTVDTLDLGGGFAAWYEGGQSIMIEDYAEAIVPLLEGKGLKIVLEPGRFISCNAGILVGEVQYLKSGGDRNFVILNTGMHHLIRPPLYDAFHFVWPVEPGEELTPVDRVKEPALKGLQKCDVVGPICESSDFLARDRPLPPVARGDLVAVFSAGAYGMSMASNYNSQPKPVEVLVDNDTFHVIRQRETYEDLIRGEGV
jgi:diaminopimelate decarboxylase